MNWDRLKTLAAWRWHESQSRSSSARKAGERISQKVDRFVRYA